MSRGVAAAILVVGMLVAWFLGEYVRVGLDLPVAVLVLGIVILWQLPQVAVARRENRPLFEEDERPRRAERMGEQP